MPTEKLSSQDRIIILGASRGLGWALYLEMVKLIPLGSFLLCSRKIFERKASVSDATQLIAEDFSKVPLAANFVTAVKEFRPTRIIYVAGGGPFGSFQAKKWNDHQWALTTTFLFPAELLHTVLSQAETFPQLRQITFVGSQIAESKPDQNAASYAAAKHALKGLISTIQLELRAPRVLLFSPGYMQTDMIPADSWPNQQGLAKNPSEVAENLISFIEKND